MGAVGGDHDDDLVLGHVCWSLSVRREDAGPALDQASAKAPPPGRRRTGVLAAVAAVAVVAIAAGIGDGLGFGHNTRAALITRGLAEISRLAISKGANPLTLAGLSGMGDLVLTCTGDLSRNRNVGLQIGQGKSLEEILGSMQMVAEGVRTTKSAKALSEREGVDRIYGNLRTAVHRLGRDEVTVRRVDEGVQIVRLPRSAE